MDEDKYFRVIRNILLAAVAACLLFVSCYEHVEYKDENGFYRYETICDSFYYKSRLVWVGKVLMRKNVKICMGYKKIKVYVPPEKLNKKYHKITKHENHN